MIVDLDTNTKSFLGDNSDFYLTGSYGKKSSWNMVKHTNKKKVVTSMCNTQGIQVYFYSFAPLGYIRALKIC